MGKKKLTVYIDEEVDKALREYVIRTSSKYEGGALSKVVEDILRKFLGVKSRKTNG